jgi:uncharacterized membrane protein
VLPAQLNNAKIYPANLFYKLTLFRLLIFLLLLLWSLGILYPVFIPFLRNMLLDFFFTQLYSTICHQESEKCISIDGVKLLVCARCTGIYSGALISAAAFFSFREIKIKAKLLFISLSIVLTDAFLVFIGIYEYSKIMSFITGLIFGGTVYLYLIYELEKFLFTSNNKIIK